MQIAHSATLPGPTRCTRCGERLTGNVAMLYPRDAERWQMTPNGDAKPAPFSRLCARHVLAHDGRVLPGPVDAVPGPSMDEVTAAIAELRQEFAETQRDDEPGDTLLSSAADMLEKLAAKYL